MPKQLLATTAIVWLGTAGFALAENASSKSSKSGQDGETVDVVAYRTLALNDWNYDELYQDGTWSAEQLFDADVYGSGGEEIGKVENIVVGTGGKVESLILEVGGFWDIGDTHVSVPWSEIDMHMEDGEPRIEAPVTEETVEDYDVFGGIGGEFRVVDDDDPYIPRGWRATELIDDYVTLEGGARYGWVDDLVFKENGQLQAVVVHAVYGNRGAYAYPYYGYGYGFHPGYSYYDLPYSEVDIEDLKPFDYSRFHSDRSESG